MTATPRKRTPHRPGLLLVPLTVFLLSAAALGQSSNGYLVGGIGTRDEKLTSQAALGGELVFYKGVGAGAEIGAIMGHNSFGIISFNGYYHIPVSDPPARVDPFVTVGYTAGVSVSTDNLYNVGAGFHYWFYRRVGLRFELRDIVVPGARPSSHFWGFRLGFAIH